VKETEFVAALVSLACDSALGKRAIHAIALLASPALNLLPLLQFPGLLDALIASPHMEMAISALTWLTNVKDKAQQVAMATNTALVDRLVASVPRKRIASEALRRLCSSDNNRALLYEHPGLLATVTDATRVPALASTAISVLIRMAESLKMPMLRNPLVLDALLRAAGSGIEKVPNRATRCLGNLSLESENRALMRDDVRIMDALTARMGREYSKKALFRICYIGDLPNLRPPLDLSLVCSRPFHHHLSLVKALIREHPEQLSAQDASGRTPLTIAQAAHLPAPIIGLLSDCVTASDRGFSLTHLVGYSLSDFALARAQRLALICSLECAADRTALPAEEDSPGALNPGKALRGYLSGARTSRLKGYLNRGKDPWSIIGRFAF
jgi:hypothetical protein